MTIRFLSTQHFRTLMAFGVVLLTCLNVTASEGITINGLTFRDTNGPLLLTRTSAYEKEAVKVMLKEANKVASDLHLTETLPLTKENIQGAFVSIPLYVDVAGLGHIVTSNYTYYMAVSNKFNHLTITHLADKVEYVYKKKYRWRTNRADTNEAVRVARELLSQARIDVPSLETNTFIRLIQCDMGLGYYCPIYWIGWLKKGVAVRNMDDVPSVAEVWFLLPERKILNLVVWDGQYILRDSLVVTNTLELLRKTNALPNIPGGK